MGSLKLVASLRGHVGVVWSISWSPRGLLASCGVDRSVRVWHATSNTASSAEWACVAVFDNGTFLRAVRDVSWSVDGRSLAVAGFDATAFVLELMGGKKPKLEAAVSLEGHDSEVKGVGYSSSGGLLATCSRDRSVWIWEVGLDFDYDCIAVLNGHAADVKMVIWHPSLEMLASCSYDGTVRIWVEDADDWFCSETLAAHDSTVWSAAFDADGRRLATVSADASLVLWEREDPPRSVIGANACFKVLARAQHLHDGAIYSVDWNKTNGLIATGGGDDSIRILRPADPMGAKHDSEKENLSASASVSSGQPGRPGETLQSGEIVMPVSSEGCVIMATEMRAHSGDVNRVAWHPTESSVLASCGDDGLVRIWSYLVDDKASLET